MGGRGVVFGRRSIAGSGVFLGRIRGLLAVVFGVVCVEREDRVNRWVGRVVRVAGWRGAGMIVERNGVSAPRELCGCCARTDPHSKAWSRSWPCRFERG